ncbi:hypothetical protein L486_02898 [Kwoniella mangroviensis CBS 10435]|uniref:Uncharacterized protein n=1 Tax=Kwoniella mangroviensis CBS 10435 TaxID=1331196 RepID=A0A1B9IXG6_9TREE|nr:hypothetical protein L486_02898 [Kwoniella mangroviensis CBS 10435]
MKFTLTTLISIASLMALVRGQDDNYSNPILVAKPDCQSMDQFQSTSTPPEADRRTSPSRLSNLSVAQLPTRESRS